MDSTWCVLEWLFSCLIKFCEVAMVTQWLIAHCQSFPLNISNLQVLVVLVSRSLVEFLHVSRSKVLTKSSLGSK